MIKLCMDVKEINAVALSGGVDSMALLDFLRRSSNPTAVYFNHGTAHGAEAEEFVRDYCSDAGIPLVCGAIDRTRRSGESWEAYWREQRYGFLNELPYAIATAHHLNDMAEGYLMGMIQSGRPRYPRTFLEPNIYRPLLRTPKDELLAWCDRNDVPFIRDASNDDTRYLRNDVRHKVLPEILRINPGFLRVVERDFLDCKSTLQLKGV